MSRPRLHTSSIVVGLIIALLLVLIEVPGRIVGGRGGGNVWTVFEHGWPWIYLRRETAEPPLQTIVTLDGKRVSLQPGLVFNPPYPRSAPRWGIPWLSAENWRIWEADTSTEPRHWDFKYVTLACDIAMAIVLLIGITTAWELWRLRRATLFSFRFGLRGLLLAISAVAASLGWLTYIERAHQRETVLIERESERSGPMEATWFDVDHVCVAPLWLRSLVGVRVFPEYFWRASAVNIQPERGDKTDLMCAEMAQLDYVKRIGIEGHLRHPFRFSALRNLAQMKTLEVWRPTILDEQDLNELAQLKQLQKIVIEGLHELDPKALARLEAALPDCKIIDSLDDW
jgi:hypothetical protein